MELSKDLQKQLDEKLIKENISYEDYLKSLVIKDLESKLDLGKGFYYNKYIDKFYNKKDEEIKMTNTQKMIVVTLIESEDAVVSIDSLKRFAWKSRGNVSIFTVRNMIKQIRDKTFYEMIKSHSSLGYSLGCRKG